VIAGPYARDVSRGAIRTRLIVVLLGIGVMSPILYFGTQLICGLMTDGYSFAREAASDLGTSDRPYHQVFNAAALATGCSLLCGGIGLLLVSTRSIPRWVATIVVAACCLFAVAFALRGRVRLRPFLGLNIAAFGAGGAILNGENPAIAGLGQRLLAGAVFPSLALVCGLWLRALTIRTPTLKEPGVLGLAQGERT
jgi:Protein of unknown function (DUF998)